MIKLTCTERGSRISGNTLDRTTILHSGTVFGLMPAEADRGYIMKKNVIVNIYNFIRMSHVEPSIFIQDDYETVKNQMILIRQYGFPATYALKYDALMEPRYQELLKTYAGGRDEIAAWWEITEELCQKAGVRFRGVQSSEYDERVNSAYSIGYTPEERRKIVDAYMDDFYSVFGFFPKTIGSWVLDTATVSHAAEKYGILGCAICRDQMGTDGFTLWGGFPNGIYYPSQKNENIPAQTPEGQLGIPVFRLLGPDPIYNFEQDVRSGLHGVYTLEPSWLIGRNPQWISWFFDCLIKEDSLGTGYAHIGQENNFLWENIKPGMEPQLMKLKQLLASQADSITETDTGILRVETMAESAAWFQKTYRITPPMTFQASRDWDAGRNLSAQWYASSCYRLGFLGEEGRLRIRDAFLYRQDYPSRYLNQPMQSPKSTFDALPLLFPQLWTDQAGQRPYIRLEDEAGKEPSGSVRYRALDELTSRAELYEKDTEHLSAVFTMHPDHVLLEGNYHLVFDFLPVFQSCSGRNILLSHNGFDYDFRVAEGLICRAGQNGLEICPEPDPSGHHTGRIRLDFGNPASKEDIFISDSSKNSPDAPDHVHTSSSFFGKASGMASKQIAVPPLPVIAHPESCIFPAGKEGCVELTAAEPGEIRYTLDGTKPQKSSPLYTRSLCLTQDAVLSAKLFLPDGRCSETAVWQYRFGLTEIRLTSSTAFDPRPVFGGNGIQDLLNSKRGSLDYLDGRWRGTLKDLDIWGELPAPAFVGAITIGFLSHHRSGIIFPETLQLYAGPDRGHLTLSAELALPCQPCPREIAKQDFTLPVRRTVGCFRLIARRYAKMPQWCCYKGTENVFTMVDNIIVSP